MPALSERCLPFQVGLMPGLSQGAKAAIPVREGCLGERGQKEAADVLSPDELLDRSTDQAAQLAGDGPGLQDEREGGGVSAKTETFPVVHRIDRRLGTKMREDDTRTAAEGGQQHILRLDRIAKDPGGLGRNAGFRRGRQQWEGTDIAQAQDRNRLVQVCETVSRWEVGQEKGT